MGLAFNSLLDAFFLYAKLDIILKAFLINIFLINGWILWRIFFLCIIIFLFPQQLHRQIK